MDHRYVNELPHAPSIHTVVAFPRPFFYFLFHIIYQRHNLNGTITVRTVERTLECERDLLTDGDEEAKGRVCDILTSIQVPCYRSIVDKFTAKLMRVYVKGPRGLGSHHCIKMKVQMLVPVEEFPIERLEPIGYHESVIQSPGPRTPEAIELHLVPTTRLEAGELCVVCQCPLLQDHNLCVRMPMCTHIFHRSCIGPWLTTDGTCPVCRAPFPN